MTASIGRRRSRLFVLLAVSFLCACNGDGTGPLEGGLFLSFRANGALVEFTDQLSLLAAFEAVSTQYVLLITGFETTSSSNAGIQIYDGNPITTQTYSGYTGGTAPEGVLVSYVTPDNVVYTLDTSGPVDATVTITEIGSVRIRGTFSGTLSSAGQPDLVITDGEFLVLRTN